MLLDSQISLETVAGLKRLRPNFQANGTLNFGDADLQNLEKPAKEKLSPGDAAC